MVKSKDDDSGAVNFDGLLQDLCTTEKESKHDGEDHNGNSNAGPAQFDENNDMANEGRAVSCPDEHNQMDYEGDDFLQQFY
jgi:hypothetical protein